MIRGIALMGLNGCGKSTLAHALAKSVEENLSSIRSVLETME